MKARIGLLGGSFDPVHVAHLALGRIALDRLALDRLIWMPVGQAWQKKAGHASADDRLAMLQLAIEGEPRFELSDLEIRRAGPSYTIDTVMALQSHTQSQSQSQSQAHAKTPGTDWFLVIGQDQYAGLPTWHRWKELLPLVTLAVAGRQGREPEAPAQLQAMPHAMVTMPLPAMAISSTAVRARVRAGETIADLVPAQVASYIELNGLYRADIRI
jgi:nicotinate-nucleotide adenylyltransferase